MAEHEAVIRKALDSGLQKIVLVGAEFGKAMKQLQVSGVEHFMTSDELAAWVEKEKIQGAVVLIKGSRGIKMEKVVGKL